MCGRRGNGTPIFEKRVDGGYIYIYKNIIVTMPSNVDTWRVCERSIVFWGSQSKKNQSSPII